ncbi:MAG: hypothetical protein MR835_03340 [Erysipelotrichaceae bacterium]|nr:hypothetical protein [Erysipelotrichaceae bacterium]
MKRKIFNMITIIICVFVLIELLIKKEIIYDSVIYALNMWVNNLIPALFPFFIISDILINYNITLYIPKIIKDFCKSIFNITDNMLSILFLSMISGFPSNARNTRIMYDNNLISLEEANHILIFSHFSNPIFVLTTVGVFFFNYESVGIILLIAHYLSNFILGFLCRGKIKISPNSKNNLCIEDKSFGGVFIDAIRKAIDTILLICGIVVINLLLSSIVTNAFNFNVYNSVLVKGLFEITIGIDAISKIDLSLRFKMIITSCFLAFGGLSVHMQVYSQIVNTKIKYIYFFLGRIWQAILAGIITYFLYFTII